MLRAPEPGETFADRYVVERVLGRGGMGVVFAAKHPLLGQTVAIKLLLPEIADVEDHRRRFVNEARASAKIENDHVVRVLDVATLASGQPYIVMEHLEGTDLGRLIADQNLDVSEAVDYVLQALCGVAAAHLQGIVHRDLKPSNLFRADRRDRSRIVKVLDFGISKVSDGGGETTTDALLGSPAYMSPEQTRSSKSVDARADIWSLGVILYELLSGKRPFTGGHGGQVLVAVLEHEPARLDASIPRGLAAVVMKCLEKDPDRRYATAAELSRALAPFAPPTSKPLLDRIDGMADDLAATLTSSPRPLVSDDAVSRTMKEPTTPSTRRSALVGGAVGTAITGAIAITAFVLGSGARTASTPSPATTPASTPPASASASIPTPIAPDPLPASATAAAATSSASISTPAPRPVPTPKPDAAPAPSTSAAPADPITRTRKE